MRMEINPKDRDNTLSYQKQYGKDPVVVIYGGYVTVATSGGPFTFQFDPLWIDLNDSWQVYDSGHLYQLKVNRDHKGAFKYTVRDLDRDGYNDLLLPCVKNETGYFANSKFRLKCYLAGTNRQFYAFGEDTYLFVF